MSLPDTEETLRADVRLLSSILGEIIREHDGPEALELIEGLRKAGITLRQGRLPGGREALAERVESLDLADLEQVARAFTQFFHLANAAEEQQRIRVLRRRDAWGGGPTVNVPGAMGIEGSIAEAGARLKRAGVSADEMHALLGRLLVMPVLTAHPTEARRRTLLGHLRELARVLDRLDDPRQGSHDRARFVALLREVVTLLYSTEEARAARPSPFDEVRAGLHVFEQTLLDITPVVYRSLEEMLRAAWPEEHFAIGPALRWGTWIGGDRDGNPNVTAEVTRYAFERQRALCIQRYLRDAEMLEHELSISSRRVPEAGLVELAASIDLERERLPEVAARARRQAHLEPWREKLMFIRTRLEATRVRGDAAYPSARHYLDDLRLLERALAACGLSHVASGRIRDARRRAEVFGFHLATLDIRQHSALHEAAVDELLARTGTSGYARLDEEGRVSLLTSLLDRADVGAPRDRAGLSPQTAEILATLDVVGRARRELGPEACERYVVSFTSSVSDVLEVLFLCRAAHLAPDELRPVPLLEQLDDLDRAGELVARLLDLRPVRAALRGEIEVMIGYSDSGKQVGYVASSVALYRAQEVLARVAAERNFTLTVFHGRGGAIGRGGGPSNRAIRAQPPRALAGRLRVTEQGETITARYARAEIARRDLEQMVSAVVVGSLCGESEHHATVHERSARAATVERAAEAARAAYQELLADPDCLARYTAAATPILHIADLPLASRPASRRGGRTLAFEELRAIPWVFSWNQSRHGVPGWFGLGTALDAIAAEEGDDRARHLYEEWPFFRALVDNGELALVRADIEVAARYARLAGPEGAALFERIRDEHDRTVRAVLRVTRHGELLAGYPAILHTVRRRNPYIDVLSHTQITLLERLHATADPAEQARIREVLFITINGIAAGLQTAG